MEMTTEDKIRIIISDDDPAAVELLHKGLKAYPWAEVVATTSEGAEATVNLIESCNPDLIFLDIELGPEVSGLDVIRGMGDSERSNIKIVFYSSYRKYLLQAIRLDAFDFLLKPFDPEELAIIMNRYRHDGMRSPGMLPELQRALKSSSDVRALSITTITNDKLILAPHKIVFFKYDSERKLWEVVLDDFKRIILKRHTKAETILNFGPDFIRTHKTYIINIMYLGMISNAECTLVPPYDTMEIRISKAYKRQLLDRFYDL